MWWHTVQEKRQEKAAERQRKQEERQARLEQLEKQLQGLNSSSAKDQSEGQPGAGPHGAGDEDPTHDAGDAPEGEEDPKLGARNDRSSSRARSKSRDRSQSRDRSDDEQGKSDDEGNKMLPQHLHPCERLGLCQTLGDIRQRHLCMV